MFASLEKCIGDVRTDCTPGLTCSLVLFSGTKTECTYADDCNSLNFVGEARWLVLSISGHFGCCQMRGYAGVVDDRYA